MALKRGLAALREMRDSGDATKGSGIWKLWLKDGEIAKFWFVTDGEEAAVPLIHLVPKGGGAGKKKWTKDVSCAKESEEDETYCALCEDDRIDPETNKRLISRAFPRLVMLTYVQAVFHPYQSTKADAQWEPVKGAASTMFKETVNAYRLLIAKPKLQNQIQGAYAGDPTADDFLTRKATLLDRPYQLVRSGTNRDAQETLRSGAVEQMPAAVREAIAKAPPLDEVVKAEFYDGVPATRAGSGRAGYDPDAVSPALPEDDELESF